MNVLSEKIRYKRVCKIIEVCDTLKGKLLEFTYNMPNENKSEIINSNEMIYFYTSNGEPKYDFASKIKVGDFIIEYL